MSFRAGSSAFNLKRGEWSGWLLAAVCALLLTAPSQAASLSESFGKSHVSGEVVLRWLYSQSNGEVGVEERRAAVLNALCAAGALDRQEAEVLLASLESGAPKVAQQNQNHTPPAEWQTADVPAVLSLATAPRYDASRRLAAFSLTSHEAAVRSGIRPYCFLE